MIEIIKDTADLWTYLKNSDQRILLYGMGDGADKILDVCSDKGIEVSGVFASDGFSKSKIFRGFEVTDYSSAKQKFGKFTVLMSFASCRDEVLDNVKRIMSENELYVPDVPVFGDGLFDSSFVKDNYERFEYVYSLLSDEKSKNNYVNLILGKLTGKPEYLINSETLVSEAYENIIRPTADSHYVDIGAYNGDTIREYLSYSGGYKTITAFEPDLKNYNKLCRFASDEGIDSTHFHNIAAWSKKESLVFYSRSGRNSASTTSHKQAKSIVIQADKCDCYIDSPVDFINIDAEGSDRNAIIGLSDTIAKYRPVISCAIYHRNEDFFDIPILLKEMYGKCKIYIRHFKYLPAWDTNVYVVPV